MCSESTRCTAGSAHTALYPALYPAVSARAAAVSAQ